MVDTTQVQQLQVQAGHMAVPGLLPTSKFRHTAYRMCANQQTTGEVEITIS